jgi:SAM-dependent methyltransferase
VLPPEEVQDYYRSGVERDRLEQGAGRLEFARTLELLSRYLPASPARILDVGGAFGIYAFALAAQGYAVHVVDALPEHVEAVRDRRAEQVSAAVGDARALDVADESFDAVMVMGPLYHLIEEDDRIRALIEARRVARSGAPVFGACVSRFASLLDGLFNSYVDDPTFVELLQRDLRFGIHRNDTGDPRYFTTAYFHRREELVREMMDAGLEIEGVFGVEGPGWLLRDFDERWADPERRERILFAARAVEQDSALLSMSAHLLAVARRPS